MHACVNKMDTSSVRQAQKCTGKKILRNKTVCRTKKVIYETEKIKNKKIEKI